MENKHSIDRWIVGASLGLILIATLPAVLYPEAAAHRLDVIYRFISSQLGIAYLWGAMGGLGFLTWLALSRHGRIRLGDQDQPPEFSTYSWVGMLFCAGVGAGMLYWAGIEWAYYYETPPFGLTPRSLDAAEWASAYPLFHWGITAWGIYCLPAVAIGYQYHVKKAPMLRLSTALQPFLGEHADRTFIGRTVDLLFIISLIGGAGTSLGLSTPMIANVLSELAGVPSNFTIEFAVILFSVILFSASVYLGLRKGIKRLSDINVTLAILLMLFILLAGPTLFIIKNATNSVGLMVDNFFRMNTWTDPFTNSGFVENWTIFYWAWWMAYAPFVGLFVARISGGRTIRQIIGGMLFFGSLGSALFFSVFGGWGMHLELSGTLSVTEVIAESGGPAAITAILSALPWKSAVLILFAVVAIIFSATTYDSASYSLASVATRRLPAGEDPDKWHRVFWALILGLLPVTLIYVGGLKVSQSASLVASLPILVLNVAIAAGLAVSLRKDNSPGQ